jgi:hypothetical protein
MSRKRIVELVMRVLYLKTDSKESSEVELDLGFQRGLLMTTS